jgi:hypothetical protein
LIGYTIFQQGVEKCCGKVCRIIGFCCDKQGVEKFDRHV